MFVVICSVLNEDIMPMAGMSWIFWKTVAINRSRAAHAPGYQEIVPTPKCGRLRPSGISWFEVYIHKNPTFVPRSAEVDAAPHQTVTKSYWILTISLVESEPLLSWPWDATFWQIREDWDPSSFGPRKISGEENFDRIKNPSSISCRFRVLLFPSRVEAQTRLHNIIYPSNKARSELIYNIMYQKSWFRRSIPFRTVTYPLIFLERNSYESIS